MTTAIIANQHTYLNLEERYWSKVDTRDEDECWPWTAYCNKKGYGILSYQGRAVMARRVGWMLINGEYPPANMHICHTCDNPPCMNPKHWFLGTNADNVADRQSKGRQAKGIANVHAKLTPMKVAIIRRIYARNPYWGAQRDLCKRFGVSSGAMSQIINGRRWK